MHIIEIGEYGSCLGFCCEVLIFCRINGFCCSFLFLVFDGTWLLCAGFLYLMEFCLIALKVEKEMKLGLVSF